MVENLGKTEKNSQNMEKSVSIRGLDADYSPHTAMGIDKNMFTKMSGATMDTLYDVVKQSPEVLGAVKAIIEDIMADGYKFEGAKSAIKKAQEFELSSDFYKIMTNTLFEVVVTGNAYTLKLAVNEDKIKDALTTLTKEFAEKLGVRITKQSLALIQTKYTRPKDLQILKSSTVKINFDETGLVKSFEQRIGGEKRAYSPSDVIHLTLMNIGGTPYGFCGIEPLLSDIGTLIFAKEYAGKYFENDGLPYFIFKLPDATPDDRNYKKLRDELKELQKKENKYRSMVITGNVDPVQVQRFDKDMEFRQLIQHFTQVILIALGVPAHRVNWTIDVKQVGGAVNRSYEGYYKKISFIQKVIENKFNKELWKPHFNVMMKFNRAYKIDEMREAQIVQILTQVGAINLEEARELMGMTPELKKGTPATKTGDDNRIDFRADKKREEGRENEGIPELPMDNKVKNLTKNMEELIEVGWDNFIKIVEHKLGTGNFNKANVLYRETEEYITLFFADGNWKYKCLIDKSSIDLETFKTEWLQYAVKIHS